MKIRWLPKAMTERRNELNWIALDSVAAAIEQGERLDAQIGQLAHFPELGRESVLPDVRQLVISHTQFIVYYRVRQEFIEIIRLRHAAQKRLTLVK